MRSPFPGMDPYLEQHWPDIHARLMGEVRDCIQVQLPEELVGRICITGEVYRDEELEIRGRTTQFSKSDYLSSRQSDREISAAIIDEPIMLRHLGDPTRLRNVIISDAAGNRMVTAIEVLSPWNKSTGKAVAAYLEKREKYIDSETNLVEIDLIRTGDWTDMIGPYHVPAHARKTYRVTVTHAPATRQCGISLSLWSSSPRNCWFS